MNIKQSKALEIAKKFTLNEYSESKVSIVDEDYKISFETDGFGRTVLELDEDYWLVTFSLKNAEKSMFDTDSEYFIVLVGAESGEPHWLPMM
jgi:hypothetical protein